MSDFIKKLKGLELPDELLEAVSGGVLTAKQRESLECVRKDYEALREEEKERIRAVYTEVWDTASDEDKAMLYDDEFTICVFELYMGRSIR